MSRVYRFRPDEDDFDYEDEHVELESDKDEYGDDDLDEVDDEAIAYRTRHRNGTPAAEPSVEREPLTEEPLVDFGQGPASEAEAFEQHQSAQEQPPKVESVGIAGSETAKTEPSAPITKSAASTSKQGSGRTKVTVEHSTRSANRRSAPTKTSLPKKKAAQKAASKKVVAKSEAAGSPKKAAKTKQATAAPKKAAKKVPAKKAPVKRAAVKKTAAAKAAVKKAPPKKSPAKKAAKKRR